MMMLRRAARVMGVWVAAMGAVTALTVAPSAVATTALVVPDGVYRIAFNGEQKGLLSHISRLEGSPTVLMGPFHHDRDYQRWEIVRDSRTTQIVRNVGSGLYLGLGEKEPKHHRPVVATPYPHSWAIHPGSTPDRMFITSVVGSGLRLDRSPLLIFPPRVDIQEPRAGAGTVSPGCTQT
ncbi:hypothetical protein ACFXGA_22895 [Actinosynnema sp. NPDC059335]|uniref:hypothetical protein n=1 Tax=Actinosynnema sp. NPDC059335 TaxID=3346804 RepID=UPI003670D439